MFSEKDIKNSTSSWRSKVQDLGFATSIYDRVKSEKELSKLKVNREDVGQIKKICLPDTRLFRDCPDDIKKVLDSVVVSSKKSRSLSEYLRQHKRKFNQRSPSNNIAAFYSKPLMFLTCQQLFVHITYNIPFEDFPYKNPTLAEREKYLSIWKESIEHSNKIRDKKKESDLVVLSLLDSWNAKDPVLQYLKETGDIGKFQTGFCSTRVILQKQPNLFLTVCFLGEALFYRTSEQKWVWRKAVVMGFRKSDCTFEISFPDSISKRVTRLGIRFPCDDISPFEKRRAEFQMALERKNNAQNTVDFLKFHQQQQNRREIPISIQRNIRNRNSQIIKQIPDEVKQRYHNAYIRYLVFYMTKSKEVSELMVQNGLSVQNFLPEEKKWKTQKRTVHTSITHSLSCIKILASLVKSYHSIENELRFIEIPHTDAPISVYKLHDLQEERFSNAIERLLVWRKNLKDEFYSHEELVDRNIRSINDYQGSLLHRILEKSRFVTQRLMAKTCIASMNEFSTYIDSYIQFNKPPLLLLKLCCSETEGEMEYLPRIDTIEEMFQSVQTIPDRLRMSFPWIASEVVDLFELPQKEFISANSSVFSETKKISDKIEKSKDVCVTHLNNLSKKFAELYSSISSLSETDSAVTSSTMSNDFEDIDVCTSRMSKMGIDIKELDARLQKFKSFCSEIEEISDSKVTLGLFMIDCTMAKEQLLLKVESEQKRFFEAIETEILQSCTYILETGKHISNSMITDSPDIESFKKIKNLQTKVADNLIPSIVNASSDIEQKKQILEDNAYQYSRNLLESVFTVKKLPQELKLKIQSNKTAEDALLDKFKLKLEQDQKEFEMEISKNAETLTAFMNYGPAGEQLVEKHSQQADLFQEQLLEQISKSEEFRSQEFFFGMEPTEYSELEYIKNAFQPFLRLWSLGSMFNLEYKQWMTGPLSQLSRKQIETSLKKTIQTSTALIKHFRSQSDQFAKPLEFAEEIVNKVKQLKKLLPLIDSLTNKGLKDRHWNLIAEIFHEKAVKENSEMDSKKIFRIIPSKNPAFAFSTFIELGAKSIESEIAEISLKADKEYSLERSLDQMKDQWNSIELHVKEHNESGTFLLYETDDMLLVLDDHLVNLQSIKTSPYNTPFVDQISAFEKKLMTVSDILDEWLQFQSKWLYLDPIFSGGDISRQLPAESSKYEVVNGFWRTIMDQCKKFAGSILGFIEDHPQLFQKFKEGNEVLELIQKGLADYLDTKRSAFPRFYFLSNDELLDIISQTKDPCAVQAHISKCFEYVSQLNFSESVEVTGVSSSEGEEVRFLRDIAVNSPKLCGRAEIWLKQVENSIIETLKKLHLDCFNDSLTTNRKKWIGKWPGQCVLTINQVNWTSDVERVLESKSIEELEEFLTKQNENLIEVVGMVRGNLTKVERKKLQPLLVIDVHARDVIQSMVNNGPSDIQGFAWQSQLRYYLQSKEINVSMMNTRRKYCYEYLGNCMRLVITPLTDRCYRTLMGALKLNLGGSLEGPAGTGKTETVKDLAKALATPCVVYNCSDSLDVMAMAKFFKGLISSGAWACFDEFNRIDIEVLSVVAQQVLTIQQGQAMKADKILFDGCMVPLNPSCAVYITMNPGYAGRAELPDNLKALFRTVAMMVPDYAVICEIMLYSCGYVDARTLSKKISGSLRLSSEQLSSQCHYDFGMRNIKSMLTAAARYKEQSPDLSEDRLVMKALVDCNLSKFTADDIILFKRIVNDLFPTTELQLESTTGKEKLIEIVKTICKEKKIIATDYFLTKVMELHATLGVRHGLMVVGDTISSKSTLINVLSEGLSRFSETEDISELDYCGKVETFVINPKSQSSQYLYGQFDANTHEWKNGILAVTYKNCASDPSSVKKWILFDGPVDAIWIENMNTVLDDNKKLCLSSGEIVKLSNEMSILFETDDLSVASPATISRVGMVYVEPYGLGFRPLLENLTTKHKDYDKIQKFVSKYFPDLYKATENIDSLLDISECGMMLNLGRLLNCFEDHNSDSMAFCLIWTLGGNTTIQGRTKFSESVKDCFKEVLPKFILSSSESVFNFYYDHLTKKWIDWMKSEKVFQVSQEIINEGKFHEIIVPTYQTVQSRKFLELLSSCGNNILFTGPTGTSKSVVMQEYISSLDVNSYKVQKITLSAKTSVEQLHEALVATVSKRSKGVLGPKVGTKLLVFVDDLHMPTKEEYGAQPPIELIRQLLDQKGLYVEQIFKQFVDLVLTTCCSPPSSGGNKISSRLVRHFNTFGFVDICQSELERIYSTTVGSWMSQQGFPSKAKSVCIDIVKASVEAFSWVSSTLKPRPDRIHYSFNIRDLSNLFQGMFRAKISDLTSTDIVWKLWRHESDRTFRDRLICLADLEKYDKKIDQIHQISESVLFTQVHSDSYRQVLDSTSLKEKIYESIRSLNEESQNPVSLNMFQDALSHVLRISRIISLGNGLLIGVGGSGKKSLTRLATYLMEYSLFTLEISDGYTEQDWEDNLKELLIQCGSEKVDTVFMITEDDMKFSRFYEDLNNLLNNSEIPGLFSKEEKSTLKISWEEFVTNVSRHLKIIIGLSPISPDFSKNLQDFPAFINCCTIDWFLKWSEDALTEVGSSALTFLENDQRMNVVKALVKLHSIAEDTCETFYKNENRKAYLTSLSYLTLLKTFEAMYSEKRDQLQKSLQKYRTGLDQLNDASVQVTDMQKSISELRPKLKQSTEDADRLLERVTEKTKDADEKRHVVGEDRKVCSQKMKEADEIAKDCEEQLAIALPAYESAIAALKCLKKSDIGELKVMKKPPVLVTTTMKAVCIMLGIKPVKVGEVGKKVNNYWEPSMKQLGNPRFLQTLLAFDKDNIKPEIIQKIEEMINTNPDFIPEKVAKSSGAAEGLCKWVIALHSYDKVAKVVGPKKEALKVARAQAKTAKEALDAKEAELQQILALLQDLNTQAEAAKKKKEDLQAQLATCKARLERAHTLISGLSTESKRWVEKASLLEKLLGAVLGNIILSAGFVSYLGVFTDKYRHSCIDKWIQALSEENIQCQSAKEFSLRQIVGDEVQIEQWIQMKLPNNTFSISNAIIKQKSQLSPYFIDPQSQASHWLNSTGGYEYTRLDDRSFVRTVSSCIQLGKKLVVLDVGETIPSNLFPVLMKQVFSSGNKQFIKFCGEVLDYDNSFEIVLLSSMPNPTLIPSISTKLCAINFMATKGSLIDRCVNMVVSHDEPELESQRQQCIISQAENNKKLIQIEADILALLSSSKGNILDDLELIQALKDAKRASTEVEQEMMVLNKTSEKIANVRSRYIPLGIIGASGYLTVARLVALDPMYQFSLSWYLDIFSGSIQAEETKGKENRVKNLANHFVSSLYSDVCQCLYREHKLTFSLLLSFTLNFENTAEGRVAFDKLTENQDEFLLVRIKKYIDSSMSEFPGCYSGVPELNLSKCFLRSKSCQPLLFLLSPGDDPMKDLLDLCKEKEIVPTIISLGQGQGPKAAQAILDGKENGGWVILQNCHLAVSWLPALERILHELSESGAHDEFRLWMTSRPTPAFPRYILQQSLKMTNEPPKGLQQNIVRSVSSIPNDYLENGIQAANLLVRLSIFHGIVQERRKFGAIGWNIPYEFNDSDLRISQTQLIQFVTDGTEDSKPAEMIRELRMLEELDGDAVNTDTDIDLTSLKYVVGELNYGSRVTDDLDRRCLTSLLDSFLTLDEYSWIGEDITKENLVNNLKKEIPTEAPAEIFGLHKNANTKLAKQEGETMTREFLDVGIMGSITAADSRKAVFGDMLANVPAMLDRIDLKLTTETESYDIVLMQEVDRYNGLLVRVRADLENTIKAKKGEINFSPELLKIENYLSRNLTPTSWIQASYPSSLPADRWITDLKKRCAFLQSWAKDGAPTVFWLPGFFFTQAFLTATLQRHSRSHGVSIDKLGFECDVVRNPKHSPEMGTYITGLFFEGCCWDEEYERISESNDNELYSPAPVFWLKPVEISKIKKKDGYYDCPVYKEGKRTGTLSTTGHSTNFVMMLNLRCQHDNDHWIKRGAALLCERR